MPTRSPQRFCKPRPGPIRQSRGSGRAGGSGRQWGGAGRARRSRLSARAASPLRPACGARPALGFFHCENAPGLAVRVLVVSQQPRHQHHQPDQREYETKPVHQPFPNAASAGHTDASDPHLSENTAMRTFCHWFPSRSNGGAIPERRDIFPLPAMPGRHRQPTGDWRTGLEVAGRVEMRSADKSHSALSGHIIVSERGRSSDCRAIRPFPGRRKSRREARAKTGSAQTREHRRGMTGPPRGIQTALPPTTIVKHVAISRLRAANRTPRN